MCVNNVPRVALDSGTAGIRTRDLLIANPAPYRYATEPRCDSGLSKILITNMIAACTKNVKQKSMTKL